MISSYKDMFIDTIVKACGDMKFAEAEWDAYEESTINDDYLDPPKEAAEECMSCWSE